MTPDMAVTAFGDAANDSIIIELRQMLDKQVFEPVVSGNHSTIPSTMFVKRKTTATGDFSKFKARLVAGGHRQRKDPTRTFYSPTASASSILTIIAIAASEGRQVVTVDINGAYLLADMDDEVYMTLSPLLSKRLCDIQPDYKRFVNGKGMITVKLLKALYGCIQSAKLWFHTIQRMLLADGFIQNPHDKCIFNKEANGKMITIGLYVDDLLITSQDPTLIDILISELTKSFKRIEVNRGTVHDYLGMRLEFTKQSRTVKISMSGYINTLVASHSITTVSNFPASPDLLKLSKDDNDLLDDSAQKELHSSVAKIQYLASRVRSDIQFVVSHLASRVHKYTRSDQEKVRRVLQYLAGTSELGLTLHIPDTSSITMTLYADASFGIHEMHRSHSGGCLTLGKGSISWKSKKQTLTTTSTAEAELVALSEMASLVFHAEKFLIAQGCTVSEKVLFQDNMTTIHMLTSEHPGTLRNAHIGSKFFFLRDHISSGNIKIRHLASKLMAADLLTKSVNGDLFNRLRSTLLGE
jgi:hypothetical protein